MSVSVCVCVLSQDFKQKIQYHVAAMEKTDLSEYRTIVQCVKQLQNSTSDKFLQILIRILNSNILFIKCQIKFNQI